ncbi:cache domain-containing protein, partial [Helicobacter sp. 11S02629-2]|uniref:cache domain-containing protein n=1 Tax=Helicobacter sp. 11S02629-2 TaxID=1476195 RepID=UPI00117A0769
MRRSISTKVGLVVAIVVIIVLVILSAIVIINAKDSLRKQVDTTLRYTAIGVGRTAESALSQVATSTKLVDSKIDLLLGDAKNANDGIELSAATLKRELSTMLASTRLGLASTLYIKGVKVDDPRYQLGDDVIITALQRGSEVSFTDLQNSQEILKNSPAIKQALDTDKPVFGAPNTANILGKDYYSLQMAFPVHKDGKVIGVLSQRIDLDYFDGIINDTSNDQWPEVGRFLVHPDGLVIVGYRAQHPNGKMFTSLSSDPQHQKNAARVLKGENFVTENYLQSRGDYALIANHSFTLPAFGIKLGSYVSVPAKIALKPVTTLIWIIVITAIVAIIIIVLFFYFYIDKAFIKRVRNIQATL